MNRVISAMQSVLGKATNDGVYNQRSKGDDHQRNASENKGLAVLPQPLASQLGTWVVRLLRISMEALLPVSSAYDSGAISQLNYHPQL